MTIDANRHSFTHQIVDVFEEEQMPRARYMDNLASCLEGAARKARMVHQTRCMDDLDELLEHLLDVISLVGEPYQLESFQCRIKDIVDGTVCHVCESYNAKLYDDDPYKTCAACIGEQHRLTIERTGNGR